MAVLCLMRDVLPVLAQLSQKMQSEGTDISCLVDGIPRARRIIEDQIDNPGPCYEGHKAAPRGCADAAGTTAGQTFGLRTSGLLICSPSSRN